MDEASWLSLVSGIVRVTACGRTRAKFRPTVNSLSPADRRGTADVVFTSHGVQILFIE